MAHDANAKIVHLPDYRFANYCLERYRLNRGVYNLIDGWLYEQGWHEIGERRELILSFLESCGGEDVPSEGSKFLKFGKGNFITRIRQFVSGIPGPYRPHSPIT